MSKRRKAFSLLELLISIAILSIIAVVLAPTISMGVDLFLMARTQELLTREAKFSLNLISEELKFKCASLTELTDKRLTFLTCATCDPASTQISYEWDEANKRLLRTLGAISGGQTDILAERVNFAEFRGFTGFDLSLSGGVTSLVAGIKVIQISVYIEDDKGEKKYKLVTRVMPRVMQ